ncbi:MAG: M15 family metallopeptidase [Oscillatoriales cyanobacterium SM2_2_1]|nr:M15 family metallopeptidase [Oscillatoriales cyanobacterium SM2_2_1]
MSKPESRPYTRVAIADVGDPLVPLPDDLVRITPHPYQALGAPYGDRDPFWLRQGVVSRLRLAQAWLQAHTGYSLLIVDAYRPLEVQEFMVHHALRSLVEWEGKSLTSLSAPELCQYQWRVSQFWASPSPDLATPPPHSTGAAVDLTLHDPSGITLDMGSPIDELSDRSFPDYFASDARPFHQRRQWLCQAMESAGFRQHPHEWWHFSYGDQLWAWRSGVATAFYGRVD